MMIKNIDSVVDLLPKGVLGNVNNTHHFFYGNIEALKNIKENIDINYANVISSYISDNALIVEIELVINKDNLLDIYIKLKELSSIFTVDYDGFEVIMNDNEMQQEFLPFEDFLSHYLMLKHNYLIISMHICYFWVGIN